MLIEGLLGSVIGILGSSVTAYFKYKDRKMQIENTKLKNDHEIAVINAETNAMIKEAEANIKINQAKVEGEIDIKDADAFIQSQKEGNKNLFHSTWMNKLLSVTGWWKILTYPIAGFIGFLFGFVDFLKGIIRPVLTIYLCAVSTWITWMSWEVIKMTEENITATMAMKTFNEITSIVILLTTSCVCWWFGDRRIGKSIAEMKGADRTKLDDKINI